MQDKPMALGLHLDEARKRLLVALFSLVVLSCVSFYFVQDILRVLKIPAGDALGTLSVFSPTAAILSFIKVGLAGGLILSIPVFLYQIWMFVRPSMEDRVARLGIWFVLFGTLLFLSGGIFSYFFILPASLKFLLSVGRGELQFLISLDSYVSFVLLLLLGGGVIFQMPLIVLVLSKIGVITAGQMIRGWRIAIVVILIAAAFITPTPDLVNMALMALPMMVLYVISIGIAKFTERKK